MSFVPFMDEATVLVKSLCDICLAGAFIGCILMLLESAFVLGFGRPRWPRTAPSLPSQF